MNIKVIKAVNGDEIICEVVRDEANSGTIAIKNPRILVPAGNGNVGMMDWIPIANFGPEIIELARSHVLAVANVIKQVEDIYLQVTTGLVVPSLAEQNHLQLVRE